MNTGNKAISLSKIRVKYYFTADLSRDKWWNHLQYLSCDSVGGAISDKNLVRAGSWDGLFAVRPLYYEERGHHNIRDYTKNGADHVAVICFDRHAPKLNPGQYVTVSVKIVKLFDTSNYNQTNDYSFDSVDGNYTSWHKVTGFIGRKLVWGTLP